MSKDIFSKFLLVQFIKFSFVGAIGTIVNISILYLFTELFNFYYIFSEIIAFFASLTSNYLINKRWTFKEKLENEIIFKYLKYIIVSILSLVANLSTLYYLVENFDIYYIYAEIVAIFVAFIINFIGNKLWTFQKWNIELIDNLEFERKSLSSKDIKVSIVIPTLNEHGNITSLIKKMIEILNTENISYEIIVVDDNSTDGTIQDVKLLQKSNDNIKLVLRDSPKGIGTAHIVGYNKARGDIIISIDGDLSHPPEKIPEFIHKITKGYDMVMSSRYIPGGATDKNLKFYMISKIGGYYLSKLFNIDILDFTTGYRAIRRKMWEKIKDFNYSKKNTFLIESIYFAFKCGAKLAEIPIFFKERNIGESKTPLLKESIKALYLPIKLRVHWLRYSFNK